MYTIYFKQSLEMLKQNKFFSVISVLGTALAIMMIMAILVSDSMKNICVAPEIYRDKMLYIDYQTERDTSGGNNNWNSGSVTYKVLKDYILPLETPKQITAKTGIYAPLIDRAGLKGMISANVALIDYSFWKIFAFSFLDGQAFSEEDFQSGICNAVISDKVAKQLFKGEEAVGQIFRINFRDYKVGGVVKEVSPVFEFACADIWIPYTSSPGYNQGGYEVALLVNDVNDLSVIQREMSEMEKKYTTVEGIGKSLYLRGPETHKVHRMGIRASNEEEMQEGIKIQNRKRWFILIVILLVPAINLSGLNLSRIKRRTPEIGVRKAFGAKKHVILIQILFENLITSFIGGVLGLMLSVLVIFQMKNWLLGVPANSFIPLNTIVSVPVVLSVVIVCILVNVLSTAIPAYRASQMTIVNSLTNNEKVS